MDIVMKYYTTYTDYDITTLQIVWVERHLIIVTRKTFVTPLVGVIITTHVRWM